jgi:hypothetical protein
VFGQYLIFSGKVIFEPGDKEVHYSRWDGLEVIQECGDKAIHLLPQIVMDFLMVDDVTVS